MDVKQEFLDAAKDPMEKGLVKVEVQEIVDDALGSGWEKGFKLLNEGRVRGDVVLKI